MIRALLWKEYRVNRVVLMYAGAALFGPYVLLVLRNLYAAWTDGLPAWWPKIWWMVATLSLILSLFTAAMLGGNSVAGERADRSAEFMATLPPSRGNRITAKAVFTVGILLFIWAVNLIALYVIARHAPEQPFQGSEFSDDNAGQMVAVLAVSTAIAFGASWFVSCVASSHALAGAAGIGAPVLVACFIMAAQHLLNFGEDAFTAIYITSCASLGVIGFVGGITYYVRRVEP